MKRPADGYHQLSFADLVYQYLVVTKSNSKNTNLSADIKTVYGNGYNISIDLLDMLWLTVISRSTKQLLTFINSLNPKCLKHPVSLNYEY